MHGVNLVKLPVFTCLCQLANLAVEHTSKNPWLELVNLSQQSRRVKRPMLVESLLVFGSHTSPVKNPGTATSKQGDSPNADTPKTTNFIPYVTWTLVVLNIIIFLWDRRGNPFGSNVVFADLMMRPTSIVAFVKTHGGDPTVGVTPLTSMFMHGSISHIFGNLLFLTVFGTAIEEALGSWRFTLYYLAWGLIAAAAQIYSNPASSVPTLGASGAIGGVLGAYFLLFPATKIEITIPLLAFQTIEVSAWILLGLWFLWQIFFPQPGVANWAHAGGFLAGMTTVLIMGGRLAVLKNKPNLLEAE